MSSGNVEEELRELFQGMDTDGSLLLSRHEFKAFMNELKISFSNRRWRQIFRQIDRNYDDAISFDEMFLFLYPDHHEAKVNTKTVLRWISFSIGTRAKTYFRYPNWCLSA